MTGTVHDLIDRARSAGYRIPAQEAAVLFAAVTRLAAAQGATLRSRLISIDDHGVLHLAPFDDQQPETELAYLAPELLAADAPRKSEPRVQVYAAGALGYELLTGKPAGSGAELGGPLGDIVKMALAPDRRERFGDLVQLHDAVDGVQPKMPPEQEKQVLAGLRTRVLRLGAEKEALAKLIEKLGALERTQRQSLERLDRLEEGLRRADEARRKQPSSILPGAVAGLIGAGLVVGGLWAAGMLGAAARPQVVQQQQQPPPALETPPVAKQEEPVKPAPEPVHDAGAVTAAVDASTPELVVLDAGTPDAGAVAQIDAGVAPEKPAAPPPPVKVEKPKPPPSANISPQMMAHAVATSQVKRGDRALEKNQIAEALDSYRTALENEPTLPEAFRGLATAYTLQGNEKLAVQNYEQYLKLAPKAKDAAEVRKAMEELKARSRLGGTDEK